MRWRARIAAVLCIGGAVALLGLPRTAHAKDVKVDGPGRVYTLQLPKRWRTSPDLPEPGILGHYEGWFGLPVDEPEIHLLVRHAVAFSRAAVAHDVLHGAFGELVDGTLQREESSVVSCRLIGGDGTAVWRAFVEHNGTVMYAETGLHESLLESYGKRLGEIAASLAVHKAPPRPAAPLDWVERNEEPFEVWTTARAGKTVKKVVKELRAGWEAAGPLLPGNPVMTRPPIVLAHPEDASFNAAKAGQDLSTIAFANSFSGYLHVRLRSVKGKDYQHVLRAQGARLRVRQHMGGPCMRWLEEGLAQYVQVALDSGGKGAKPKRVHVNKARPAVAKTTSTWLQQLGAMPQLGDDTPAIRLTLWAWHWFFRHGAGRDEHGERYENSIEKVHTGGDFGSAAAVWDGVDQDALLADFKAWAKKW